MSLRILVSNDDGIHAPGLEALIDIATNLSDDVWVFAPENEQSGAARALTISHPLRVRELGNKKFAISGTPSDCIQLGVGHYLEKDGKAPDLILSGVNNGQNVAEDVTVSGTIAAAFQGMQMGVPSIALSLARFKRDSAQWQTPREWAPSIIEKLRRQGWPKDVVMNINFPDRPPSEVAGIEVTRQGLRDHQIVYAEERVDLRDRKYFWFGFNGKLSNPPEGSDLRAIYEGRISITPLHLSLTHEDCLSDLAKIF